MNEQEAVNWQYNPDDSDAPQPRTVSWEASEYIDHKQGLGWFCLLALVTITIAAGLYLLTHDYFALGTTVIVGMLVGIFAHRSPRKLSYELSKKGLKIEDKIYPLSSFKSFSLLSEGPISSLEFLPLKRFMPPISVYLDSSDQSRVVAVLEDLLPLEERPPDMIDRLSRRLRF